MRVLLLRSLAPLIIAGFLVTSLSCAHDQQLVSIQVIPTDETFGAANIPVSADAGLSVQLRALGHYIHPPVTKDITNQVAWGSDDPQMITVNPTGLITATGLVCGTGTVISATVNTNTSTGGRSSSGAVVTGNMTANVVCFTGTGGGTGSATLTVGVSGTGTVTSSPAGITCPGICSAAFASPTFITLTATPTAPATNVAWSGCLPNGATCTITLTASSQVTATFF